MSRAPTEGYVYLFRLGEFHKIGSSENPEKRADAFRLLPYEFEFIHQIESADAYTIEQCLLRAFKEFKVRGEWFSLQPEHVEQIVALIRVDRIDELPKSMQSERLSRRINIKGVPIQIRIPLELAEALKSLADENRRSRIKEAEIAIEDYLAGVGFWPLPAELTKGGA